MTTVQEANRQLQQAQAAYGSATTPEARAAAAALGQQARAAGATDAGAQAVWKQGTSSSSGTSSGTSTGSSSSRSSSTTRTASPTSGGNTSSNGQVYSTGGSGKQFVYNPTTGNIGVTQNGVTKYIGSNDAGYQNTLSAMQSDTGKTFSGVSYQQANNIAKNNGVSTAQNTAQTVSPAKTGQTSYGVGELTYNPSTNTYTRTVGSNSWDVGPDDPKSDTIRNEYNARYGTYGQEQEATDQPQLNGYTKEDLEQFAVQAVNKALKDNYNPVDQSDYTNDILSYDEAMDIAQRLLEPQYTAKYQAAADTSAQNLEKSGLYDSLYGQALSAQSQNAVSQDLESAVASLANELVGESRDQALALLQSAINENQYSAGYTQENLNTGLEYTSKMLDSLISQAQTAQEYELEARAQALKEKIATSDIAYTEAQTAATKIESELAQKAAAKKAASSGSGSVSLSTGSGSSTGTTNMAAQTKPNIASNTNTTKTSQISAIESALLFAPSGARKAQILQQSFASGYITSQEMYTLAKKYGVTIGS